MIVGVISDIHDRIDHLELVMEEIDQAGCQAIICLGDLEEPSSLRSLIRLVNKRPLHLIQGNNETEIGKIKLIASKYSNITFYGISGCTTIDGLSIAMSHYPSLAEHALELKAYNVILHGHTHIASSRIIQSTIFGNPGEIQGRTGYIGYGILNTQKPSFTLHLLSFL